jgi:transposase-like protein
MALLLLHGRRPPHVIVTDLLRSYGAAMKVIGSADKHETGRWLNNRAANSHQPFDEESEPCCASAEREACKSSSPCIPQPCQREAPSLLTTNFKLLPTGC